MPKVKINLGVIEINRCDECPKVRTERTPGAGCATDYYCTATRRDKKVMGYIEWSREMKPVPKWCPLKDE